MQKTIYASPLSKVNQVEFATMLVVIDGGVDAPEILAAGVQPGAAVLRLEPGTDAMVQITTALATGHYASVHIVSHGTPGCIQLRNQQLTAETLHPYRQMVMEWGVDELWVYGCEVALDPALLEQFHRWSGAAIVASRQRVGDGQWRMDYRIGKSTSASAFSVELRQRYRGQFASTYTQSTVSVGSGPRSLAIGDLDGDGNVDDIVVANSGSNNTSVLFNNESDGFSQSTIAVGSFPFSVAIGDLDGDGAADDIAVANLRSSSVSVLFENGLSGFSPSTVSVGNDPFSVAIGDLDGDGAADDLAVANRKLGSASVFIGDGSGGFSQSTFVVGNFPVSVAIGDLDGDGNADDLVVANFRSDSISLLIEDGSGGFSRSDIAVGDNPIYVAIGDLDSDGNADDIVVANAASNTVSVLLKDGLDGFSRSDIAVGTQPYSIAIGDLDGDGNADDLAVANVISDDLSVLIGDGSGEFSRSDVTLGDGPVSVAIGDLDGDGNADDIAVANLYDKTISVLIECFLTGTRLLTDQGETSVENLSIGDMVQIDDGTLEPIKWIGRQTCHPSQVNNPLRGYPILIKAGALGNGLPHRDLKVSPDHALLVDGLLINAGALVNSTSIIKTEPTEAFTYYHIELDKHALLVAEGTAAESYLPQKEDRLAYENGAEYEELYPNGNSIILWPLDYPRVSSYTSVPRYVRKKLNSIAAEVGLVANAS